MYFYKSGQDVLLLVVQVDDYLYAGSPCLAKAFESFLHEQFQIGSTEADSFNIMGANLTQDETGTIRIDAREKLLQIQPLINGLRTKEDKDRIATDKELSAYRSVIGRLLYVGRIVSPVIAFHASHAATKCADLRLHHLRALDTVLRGIKKTSCIATYSPSTGLPFKLEVMSDVSVRTKNHKSNVREGIPILRRSRSVVHAIGWSSRLARRVARSTSTAELLAAADAVDQVTFLKYLLQEVIGMQTTELILDSCTAFHLCSTTKKPEETKNKLLLASIREEYHSRSMTIIRWTPGQSHLADDLTKDYQEIAMSLDKVLTFGSHDHPDASYAVVSDISATQDGFEISHHASSGNNGEDPAAAPAPEVEA